VLGQRPPSLPLAVLATAVVAVTVEPVRAALRRRLLASPYDVLSDFTHQVFAAVATDDLAPRMARLLAEGTSARRVEIWLLPQGPLDVRRLAARWPPDAPPIEAHPGPQVQVHDVRHEGALFGRIVRETDGVPLAPLEQRLLDDVLASAGLALRSLALTTGLRRTIALTTEHTEQLRRSRERIVLAQDAARLRLERDIHDGAQQHLVALAVNLRLASAVAAKDPVRAVPLIRDLSGATRSALATLDELSRGIYPRLLTQAGPAAALRAATATSPIPVLVEERRSGRLPTAVEAAAYFSCLEAVQNAVKHARASRVRVVLAEPDGELTLEVRDDGCGLDADASRSGPGLVALAGRIESVGGTLTVGGAPGQGTVVSARIPLRPAGPEGSGDG
jgi:signal transduction histidine kinase